MEKRYYSDMEIGSILASKVRDRVSKYLNKNVSANYNLSGKLLIIVLYVPDYVKRSYTPHMDYGMYFWKHSDNFKMNDTEEVVEQCTDRISEIIFEANRESL